jgi:hypothetical protein
VKRLDPLAAIQPEHWERARELLGLLEDDGGLRSRGDDDNITEFQIASVAGNLQAEALRRAAARLPGAPKKERKRYGVPHLRLVRGG